MDPLGLGGFNSQALHPDEDAMNSGAPPSRPQHAGPSGIGGWLARNAPTIGGIIGGVAALPLNALDAVTGVGGTALDAGAAGAGEGIGQEIKNHFDPSQKTNALKEAAIGGITQAGGDVAGDLLSPVAEKAGGLLKNYGADLLSTVGGGISKRLAKSVDVKGTTKAMSDIGVDPGDWGDVAPKIIDKVSKVVRRGVGQAGAVDTTGIKDLTDSLAGQDTQFTSPTVQKKATDFIKNGLDKLNGVEDTNAPPLLKGMGPSDILNKGVDPSDTLSFTQQLRRTANKVAGKGTNPSDDQRAVSSLYNNVADELEERLYTDGTTTAGIKGAGADKIAANGLVTDEDLQAIKDIDPNNKKLATWADTLKNPQTIASLRSSIKPMVDASKIAADKTAGKAGEGSTKSALLKGATTMGAIATAVPTHGASLLVPALETDTGKSIAAKGLDAAGNALKGTVTDKTAGKITAKDVVNKSLLQTFPKLFANNNGQVTPTNSQNQPNSSGPVSSVMDNTVQQIATQVHQQMNPQTQQNPMLQQLTPQQITQIMQTSGTRGLEAIENAQQTDLAIQKQEEPEITATQQSDVELGMNALSNLQELAPLWEKAVGSGAAGGAQGFISKLPGVGGALGNVLSEVNKNTSAGSSYKTYMDSRYDLAASLSKLATNGGLGGASGARAIEDMLPTLSDSPKTASEKMQRVAQLIQSNLQNTLKAPATNTPGQLTNFSGQTIPGTSLPGNDIGNLGLLNFIGADQTNGAQ